MKAWEDKKSLEGGITVFLSLILTCVCALTAGLFASARMAGCSWYMQMALDASVDSLMSCYHRDVWERYRLFVLEFEDREGLEKEVEAYLAPYLEEASFYPLRERRIQIEEPVRITQEQGKYFEKEILEYMKLGVWGEERDVQELTETAQRIREAENVWEVAELYQERGRNVLELERAADRIGESLKRQGELQKSAGEALDSCDGSRFLSQAGKLVHELERIPDLADDYDAQADGLKAELDSVEQEAEGRKGTMTEQTWRQLSEEMDGYRSYVDEEGSRRREVAMTRQLAEKNRAVVMRAVEEAEEVLEYIDSWEPEDEDDELDEEALWRPVRSIMDCFERDPRFETSRIGEPERMNLLESLSRMAGGDLLSHCVPEGCIVSRDILDTEALPSKEAKGGPGREPSPVEEVVGTILFHKYAAHYFSCFLTEEKREFQYEQEYLLQGLSEDRENLKATVNQLIGVREALNLLFLLGNETKRKEAEALAAAITGVSGFAPLTAVTAFFILTVWAFAESVEDVRVLLRGGRIPLLKREGDWRIALASLSERGSSAWQEDGGGKDGRGQDYQGWLELLYLGGNRETLRYRMMDMIQKNVRKMQPEFQMAHCAYRVEAELSGQGSLIPMRWYRRKEY